MTKHRSEIDYAVVVKKIDGGLELHIRELLVSVRADDLTEGWRLMQQRKQEIIDFARSAGLLDELPLPKLPPPA